MSDDNEKTDTFSSNAKEENLDISVKKINIPQNDEDGISASKSELLSIIRRRVGEINDLIKRAEKAERLLERANNYNEDLKAEIAHLSNELHGYRSFKRHGRSVLVQVSENDFIEANGEKPMPTWGTAAPGDKSLLSISESLKVVAEEVIQNQDLEEGHKNSSEKSADASSEYVYDAKTGLYYHPASGYYWDPTSYLFYDYTSGTYYQYDEATGEYTVHSQVDITANGQCQMGWPSSPSGVDSLSSEFSVLSISCQRYQKNALGNDSLVHKLLMRPICPLFLFFQQVLQKSERRCQIHVKSRKRKRKVKKPSQQKQFEDDDVIGIDGSKRQTELEQTCANNIYDTEKIFSCVKNSPKIDEVIRVPSESEDENESLRSLATGESELVSSPESGEVSDDSEENTYSAKAQTAGTLAHNVQMQYVDELAEHHPPCIRLVVLESDYLKMGSLFIITCLGGTIGREPNARHALEIPDINVSKVHAQVEFDYGYSSYFITDNGSRNGTLLNNKRLSESNVKSAAYPLNHDDILQVGSSRLLLHIHSGHETCEDCEPGQVQAKLRILNPVKNEHVILSKDEKNRQRMKELKQIKKKYGLQNSHFENTGASLSNSDYSDKAYLRRRYIGSEPAEMQNVTREMPASIQNPISASNKGHKLLSKMGWKEGEGLGKTKSGIAAPVNVELRVNQNAGLGSTSSFSLSLDNVHKAKKAQRWCAARQMYSKLEAQETDSNNHLDLNTTGLETMQCINTEKFKSSLHEADEPSSTSTISSDCMDLSRTFSQNEYSRTSTPDPPFTSSIKKYSSVPKITWVKGATQHSSSDSEKALKSQDTKIS